MTEENRLRGKKARIAGQRFELKVRNDLENAGWIVDRWSNNVSDFSEENINLPPEERKDRKLIPAKSFMGRSRTNGFPDFICFKKAIRGLPNNKFLYEVLGVECKSNGYLDKIEKEKCRWLLNNNIFSKILIAKKGKKRGKIIYTEFK